MTPDRRARILLGAGVIVGLALALAGLLEPDPAAGPPGGAVAVVNGVPIARADFERALAALESDRRGPPRDGDAARVLDRLVDEELLLQQAIALGLPRSDPRVRGQLVRAVVDAVVAEAESEAPSDAELRAFYEAERGYFLRPERRRVRRRFVRGLDAAARARADGIAAALRAGAEHVDPGDPTIPVPDDLLPEAKLEQYLGSSVTAAAMRLAPGTVSEPIAGGGGLHVLEVLDVEEAAVPPLSEIRELVEAEWRRRRGEAALREHLDGLRSEAAISREQME